MRHRRGHVLRGIRVPRRTLLRPERHPLVVHEQLRLLFA
jgi:hypothetical protein